MFTHRKSLAQMRVQLQPFGLAMNHNGDVVWYCQLPNAGYPSADSGLVYVRNEQTYVPIDYPGTPTDLEFVMICEHPRPFS